MAVLSKIKASDNVDYNIRDDYSTWGGRNLLMHTKVNETNKSLLGWNLSISNIGGYNAYLYPKANSSTAFSTGRMGSPLLEANTYYTYSVWLYFTATASFNFTSLGHFQVYNSNSAVSDKSHEDIVASRFYTPSSIAANIWTRASITFLTNNLANSTFNVYPRYNIGTNVGDLYFRDMKLEKGTKATDWSPAPEDIARFIGNETIELYG